MCVDMCAVYVYREGGRKKQEKKKKNLGHLSPPTLFFYKIVLTFPSSLYFHMNRKSLSISAKSNATGIL